MLRRYDNGCIVETYYCMIQLITNSSKISSGNSMWPVFHLCCRCSRAPCNQCSHNSNTIVFGNYSTDLLDFINKHLLPISDVCPELVGRQFKLNLHIKYDYPSTMPILATKICVIPLSMVNTRWIQIFVNQWHEEHPCTQTLYTLLQVIYSKENDKLEAHHYIRGSCCNEFCPVSRDNVKIRLCGS